MSIEKNDLITLSDSNKYIVINKVNYNDIDYYYIADINNTENLKFCYIIDDELVIVNDSDLLITLVRLFGEKMGFK